MGYSRQFERTRGVGGPTRGRGGGRARGRGRRRTRAPRRTRVRFAARVGAWDVIRARETRNELTKNERNFSGHLASTNERVE